MIFIDKKHRKHTLETNSQAMKNLVPTAYNAVPRKCSDGKRSRIESMIESMSERVRRNNSIKVITKDYTEDDLKVKLVKKNRLKTRANEVSNYKSQNHTKQKIRKPRKFARLVFLLKKHLAP